jgi:hypothetical protein
MFNSGKRGVDLKDETWWLDCPFPSSRFPIPGLLLSVLEILLRADPENFLFTGGTLTFA